LIARQEFAMKLRIAHTPARIEIERRDGSREAIHPLWLRERCASSASMDQATGQRLYNPSDLDPALSLTAVSETGSEVVVRFSDGHESRFSRGNILAEAALGVHADGLPSPLAWTSGLAPLPRHVWRAEAGTERLAMVEDFLRYGFIILSGVPSRDHAILDVARAFGYPRDTNFGVVFNVRSVPNANDLAYTPLALDPHTDNPYRHPVPGIQLLHCLVNETSGGLSTLVDGKAVGEAIAAQDPEAFGILTRTPVRFRFADASTEHVGWGPLIETDMQGTVEAINFSPRLDFVAFMPQAELEAFYRARRLLDRAFRSAEYEIRFRLDDGDLVMFDNRRLLHGRTGFDPQEGLRHLQGCYIDVDGPRSLYRVLRRGAALAAAAE
jgi:gamma-butyrobetaine dioxygenase